MVYIFLETHAAIIDGRVCCRCILKRVPLSRFSVAARFIMIFNNKAGSSIKKFFC